MAQAVAAPDRAEAAFFDFSCTSPTLGGTFSGRIDGTLQPDNNTVFVNSVGPISFNGSPIPETFNAIGSATTFIISNVIGGQGVISFDGTVIDVVGRTDATCAAPCGGVAPGAPNNVAFALIQLNPSPPPTAVSEIFDVQNWSLTAVALPAPSALALFAVAGAGLLVARRRSAASAPA